MENHIHKTDTFGFGKVAFESFEGNFVGTRPHQILSFLVIWDVQRESCTKIRDTSKIKGTEGMLLFFFCLTDVTDDDDSDTKNYI